MIKKIENVEVVNGQATTRFTPDGQTPVGIHKYTATYTQNDKYSEATSTEKEFVVNKKTTTTIQNAIGNTGEKINLIADVTGDGFTVNEGIVQFKVADVIVGTATVINGKAIFEYVIDCADESTLQASYLGVKGLYGFSNSTLAKIDVRHHSNLFIENITLQIGDELLATGRATFTNDQNETSDIPEGEIEFYVDGVKYSDVPIHNGEFTLMGDISAYPGGLKQCKLTLNETNDYESTEYTFTINVKRPVKVTIEEISASPSETITLRANVVEHSNSTPVTEGSVKFNIEGTEVLGSVVNGEATAEYTVPASIQRGSKLNYTAVFVTSNNYQDYEGVQSSVINIRYAVNVVVDNISTILGEEAILGATITSDGEPVEIGSVDFEITRIS